MTRPHWPFPPPSGPTPQGPQRRTPDDLSDFPDAPF